MIIPDVYIRTIARFGYASRGAVYFTVGVLAMEAALEIEEAEDVRGAMHAIEDQPYGMVVLLALAAGLVAYAAWRVVQAIFDVDDHGHGLRGAVLRIAFVVSASLHLGLAFAATQIGLHLGTGGGLSTRDMVAWTLAWPLGSWLVAAAAVAMAGVGIAHIHKGATGGFRKWFRAPEAAMRWIDPISRFGLVARGLLFVGVAVFIMYAAWTLEPANARGLQGLLSWMQARLYGRMLIAGVAVGLMAFGTYSIIEVFVRPVGLRNRTP